MWFSITLSGNSCSFHILSLNNCANPFTNVSFAIVTKYVILNKLLQTTRIISFPATNSNLVMKSTIKYVHSFSGISLNFSFLYWYLCSVLYPLTYITPVYIFSTSLITPGHQLLWFNAQRFKQRTNSCIEWHKRTR